MALGPLHHLTGTWANIGVRATTFLGDSMQPNLFSMNIMSEHYKGGHKILYLRVQTLSLVTFCIYASVLLLSHPYIGVLH